MRLALGHRLLFRAQHSIETPMKRNIKKHFDRIHFLRRNQLFDFYLDVDNITRFLDLIQSRHSL